MRHAVNSDARRSWTALLAQENVSLPNSSGVTPITPLPREKEPEQGTERNILTGKTPQTQDSADASTEQRLWYVMWATRRRTGNAANYFMQHDITYWVPEVTRKEEVNGEIVERRENLLSNKLFIHIEPSHLKSLREQDKNNPFLAYVRDRTKERVDNDYPPMIIPDGEMRNFQKFVSADDEFMLEVTDCTKLTHKDEENTYVVIEGKHAGLCGKRARYKKRDRIIVRCGTWVFATGYIRDTFLKVLESNTVESQTAPQSNTISRLQYAPGIPDEDFGRLLDTTGAGSPNIAFDADKTLTPAQVERWLSLRFPKRQDSQWFVLKTKGHFPVSSCLYLQERGIPTFIPLHKRAVEENGYTVYKWAPLSDEFIYAYTTLDKLGTAMQGVSMTYHYRTGASYAPGSLPMYCVNDDRMRRFIISTCLANGFIYPLNKNVEYVGADMVEVTAGQYKGVTGRLFREKGKLRVAIDNGVQRIATGSINAKGYRTTYHINLVSPALSE